MANPSPDYVAGQRDMRDRCRDAARYAGRRMNDFAIDDIPAYTRATDAIVSAIDALPLAAASDTSSDGTEKHCSCASHQQPQCAHWRMGNCPDKPADHSEAIIAADEKFNGPSEAKQQEPVAFVHRAQFERWFHDGEGATPALYRFALPGTDPIYLAPPALDREAVAKIIAGDSWGQSEISITPRMRHARLMAGRKADAILSLIGGA
jgi:hypothetical protein